MLKLDKAFLRGSYPPVVTPFRDGKVDFETFVSLVDRQVKGGSHGIVVGGTSGEPSSLTVDERCELVKAAVQTVARRIPVVAGTGSQSLAETIEITTKAEKFGADAVLVVTPYYIKPPQRGLVQYFLAVAERIELPLADLSYSRPDFCSCECVRRSRRLQNALQNLSESNTPLLTWDL